MSRFIPWNQTTSTGIGRTASVWEGRDVSLLFSSFLRVKLSSSLTIQTERVRGPRRPLARRDCFSGWVRWRFNSLIISSVSASFFPFTFSLIRSTIPPSFLSYDRVKHVATIFNNHVKWKLPWKCRWYPNRWFQIPPKDVVGIRLFDEA